jgi:hypothetical protein
MECSKGFISIAIVYAVALMYLFQKHTKFWGYIVLIVAYLLSYGYIFQFQEPMVKGATEVSRYLHDNILNKVDGSYAVKKFFSSVVTVERLYNVLIIIVSGIVVMNLYSLIKILNAFNSQSTNKKTFDIKLDKNRTKELNIFNWSFIVCNVALFLFVFYLISPIGRLNSMQFDDRVLAIGLFFVALVTAGVQFGAAWSFWREIEKLK